MDKGLHVVNSFSWYRADMALSAQALRWKYCPDGAPYDPFRIADALRILVREESLQNVEGYTECFGKEILTVLNSNAISTRKRFTLAHELGHIILIRRAQSGIPVGLKRFRTADGLRSEHQDPTEEVLCNAFAAELLIPLDDVRSCMNKQSVTPGEVCRVAQRFEVSLEASARQIVKVIGRELIGIAFWRVLPGDWVVPAWNTGFKTGYVSAVDKIKELIADASRKRIEGVGYWQAPRVCKDGERLMFTIDVMPIMRDGCLTVLRRRSSQKDMLDACERLSTLPDQPTQLELFSDCLPSRPSSGKTLLH
jgi:Zn-dependent peptidase ImmA (M78 family)